MQKVYLVAVWGPVGGYEVLGAYANESLAHRRKESEEEKRGQECAVFMHYVHGVSDA